MEGKYFFNGKDISMNLYIQIRDVINIIMEKSNLSFPDAMGRFYHSKTYKALQNTENTLWAESAGYIADRYYEEQEKTQISK
ncbi:MAG: hypothetical protein IAC13_09940 [Firmicutes bacterium]|uniref:Uncharacterized protein n=1 Tax=Candidatus Scybalomonas excrementavium TaxID=2840943 RepID=A0A9D9N8L1_9FIRM|nr:hypothetical protein [Candidatus Scybalomonas excrementavium]